MRLLCDLPTRHQEFPKGLSTPVEFSEDLSFSRPELLVLECQESRAVPSVATVVMMQGMGWCRSAEIPHPVLHCGTVSVEAQKGQCVCLKHP